MIRPEWMALPFGKGLDGPSGRKCGSHGEPLTDEDRWPWLTAIGLRLAEPPGILIVGCSALRRRYRDHIRSIAGAPVTFLHLSGPKALIAARMGARTGHFMPAKLIDSQFATLEPPGADERAGTFGIARPLEQIVNDIIAYLEPGKTVR